MAKKYSVQITRTTVESAEVIVEADSVKDAAFRAGSATAEWQAKSQTIDLGEIEMAKPTAPVPAEVGEEA